MSRVLLKLGGSVITDRAAEYPKVRSAALTRLAREIAAAHPDQLVVVHGAGSFGHPIVARTGIDKGVRDLRGRLAWAETQCWQNVLNVEIAATLGRAGLPAVPLQASAIAVMSGGRLRRLDLTVLRGLLDAGMIPVLYGTPAWDKAQGCSILSGDVLAPYIAHKLGLDFVVHATDVNGVYDADPHADPEAATFPLVSRKTWPLVRRALRRSAMIDVTGGMLTKVGELVRWARRGVRGRIIDANVPDRLRDALRGKPVGTLVSW
ncbi:MAG: isopentenyl phosphate kinase family protein [Deltaproteobacteria bacterium]|nr:isopentenyl phosphate kinase family protein [Deltaproteobacteria bacterium]